MTILDPKASHQNKEENVPPHSANQESNSRKQRTRQNYGQRERNFSHRNMSDDTDNEYRFWATSSTINQSSLRNLVPHRSTSQEVPTDDITNRNHFKPRGLSKSNNVTPSNEDVVVKPAKSGKSESKSGCSHDNKCTPPLSGMLQQTQPSDSLTPTTSHQRHSMLSFQSKNSVRHGKRSNDKKVIHVKKRIRRSSPVLGLKSHQTNLDQTSKSQVNYKEGRSASSRHLKTNEKFLKFDKTPRFNSHAFKESTHFLHTVPLHNEQYSTLLTHSVSNQNAMDINCHSRFEYIEEQPKDTVEAKHNSDDEHDQSGLKRSNEDIDFDKLEEDFVTRLKKVRGFTIKQMVDDGACLFRGVADQVYGDQNMHDEVRKNCMNYIAKNADYFGNYITEDFKSYIKRKRKLNTYGNHLEMQAMAELYNRPFEVYQYATEPINTFQTTQQSSNPPIRVSYHRNSHYNSVIDPYTATIGVGLGLPSFKPGAVEQRMVNAAIKASEDVLFEQQMLNDKFHATDWESTDDAIMEQVVRESYMDYIKVKNNDDCAESNCVKTSTAESSLAEEHKKKTIVKEFPKKGNRIASTCDSDWVSDLERWEVLSQVLAQSQQEYMDALKQQAAQSKATCSKYTK